MLYGNNPDIVDAIRTLRSPIDVGAKNAALLRLLRAAASCAGFPLSTLSDEDLVKAFYLKGQNQAASP